MYSYKLISFKFFLILLILIFGNFLFLSNTFAATHEAIVNVTPGDSLTQEDQTYTFTVTNDVSSTAKIGSIEIQLPDGFSNPVVSNLNSSPERIWLLGATNGYVDGYNLETKKVGLNAEGASSKLDNNEFIQFDIKVTNPANVNTYEWIVSPLANLGFSGTLFNVIPNQPIVTITEPVTLSSISIKKPANKVEYIVGESLDISGLEVEGLYSDSSTKIEPVLMSDISGFDSSVAVNSQTLTISLKNKTVSYSIDILPVPNSGTVFKSASDVSNIAIANGGSYHFTKSESPYLFEKGFYISKDITITSDPGVVLKVTAPYNILIFNGDFSLIGTEDEPIKITSDGVFNQIQAYNPDSSLITNVHLENVIIENGHYCFISHSYAKVDLENVTFSDCRYKPLSINGNTDITIKNIKNNVNSAIRQGVFIDISLSALLAEKDKNLNISITDSEFPQDSLHAIEIRDSSNNIANPEQAFIRINNNNFTGNVKNSSPIITSKIGKIGLLNVDAINNYWGVAEGPYIPNVTTKTNGPILNNSIKYIPFLSEPYTGEIIDEVVEEEDLFKTCCSSIMFLPGIEGSRLYNKRENGSEDQLWEANAPSDVEDLYMDSYGNSEEGIYTRDIIDKSNIFFGGKIKNEKIYQKIIENLAYLKTENKINDYKLLPYDWRYSVDDIIKNGIDLEGGQKMYIIDELEKLSKNSDTGKVTIVTHSNGGLLSKALVKELENQGKQDLIDKVIMVAAPQLGTPDAVYALLHGLEFDGAFNYIAPQEYNRKLAKDIAMTYGLLPSQKYYEGNNHIVFFDENIKDVNNLHQSYGSDIDSYNELKDFILAKVDNREDPDFNKTNLPGTGNEYLYNKAEELHGTIDNYNFPEAIKLYQVSGTGFLTNKAILYKNRKTLTKNVFTPYLIKSIYGDGTVLNKSSNIMLGENYYFDLYNYNKNNNTQFEHSNIFEADGLIDFINNINQEQNIISPYFTTSIPNYSNVKSTVIEMHSPVYIHVYDKYGNHTGPIITKDENGNTVVDIEENIPNSKYSLIGESASISLLGDEEYILKLEGYDDGEFTLDINQYNGDEIIKEQSFVNLPATNELVSEIIINAEGDLTNIILDINNDGEPDIQANDDGSIIDLNKEEVIPVEEISIPNGGAVGLSFVTNQDNLEEEINEINEDIKIEEVDNTLREIKKEEVPKKVVIKSVQNIPKKVVDNVNKNDIIIQDNNIAKGLDLSKTQVASVGKSFKFKFNLIDFIRKIFKRK